MSSLNTISSEKLWRLIGVPHGPALVDVRANEDFAADPRFIPGAIRRAYETAPSWAPEFAGRSAVVICKNGRGLSEGVAAWLRHASASSAEVLLDGHAAWAQAGLPLVPADKLPPRDSQGRTVWVTRSRPKIDRIACPWLIRRFVDPAAVFLFVSSAEVHAVAERFNGAPFDIEGAFWSHRGDLCTFDTMLDELGLRTPPLAKLAAMVRGADTARLDLAPEAPGLVAASLGLSRMYSDDLEQLAAGMTLYDAFYRWARDASDETHDWPTNKPKTIAEGPLQRRTPAKPHSAKTK
ncbi:MAG TPA: sulfurtransferase/chromate resistance protein [Methylocella sp.]|nr:sulfurtransferase/chromate resistance protein [Methylocella sp.]